MTEYARAATGWYAWLSQLVGAPPEYPYTIRMLSTFFTILALTPLVPIALLVIYDLALWLWRHATIGQRIGSVPALQSAAGPPDSRSPPTDATVQNGSPDAAEKNGRLKRKKPKGSLATPKTK